jgi:hypothetical protein
MRSADWGAVFRLQDRVLALLRRAPLCLTAGTALSRFYFRHRISTDLDFVPTGTERFDDVADFALASLRQDFPPGAVDVRVRERGLVTAYVRWEGVRLKVDILDRGPIPYPRPPREEGGLLLDPPENIVVDKVRALVERCLARDVVDLYFLLRFGGLDLREAVREARLRAPGVNPVWVAWILDRFDYGLIPGEVVWWERPAAEGEIRSFMRGVADDILGVRS